MYYAFVDGQYLGSSQHIGYLKKRVDEDMALGGFHATIYRGERSYCSRFYNSVWVYEEEPSGAARLGVQQEEERRQLSRLNESRMATGRNCGASGALEASRTARSRGKPHKLILGG